MENNKLMEYAKQLKSYRETKDLLENDLKDIRTKIDELQVKFIELMELHDLQNFSIKDLGTFYLSSDIYPKVTDQDALFEDLRNSGYDSLIKETVHAGTLKAHIKERLADKNSLPNGIEIYSKAVVRIKKL